MHRTWTLVFDVTGILIFVAAGRRTHETATSIAGIVETAAPFLIGLVAGWVAMRAWRSPTALRTGYGVVVSTIVLGMLLRRLVWKDGTALTFVLIAVVILSALLIGWRIAFAVTRRPPEGPGVAD